MLPWMLVRQIADDAVHLDPATIPGLLCACHATVEWQRDLVITAVAADGMALRYAPPSLRNDHNVVRTALTSDPRALQFASWRLRNDDEIVHHAAIRMPTALGFARAIPRFTPIVVASALRSASAMGGQAVVYAVLALIDEVCSHPEARLMVTEPAYEDLRLEERQLGLFHLIHQSRG